MKILLTIVLLGATAGWAEPIGVTLVDAGKPVVADTRGFVVSPYTLSIDGVEYSALCVDDKHQSRIGTTWHANLTAVDSSNLQNTYTPLSGQEYKEAAYLYSQITVPNADRIDIQHAVWGIMDYRIDSLSVLNSLTGHAGALATDRGAVPYIRAALNNYAEMNLFGYKVVSSSDRSHLNQEYLINTAPEPGSCALFGVGLVLGSALCGWIRKRRAL